MNRLFCAFACVVIGLCITNRSAAAVVNERLYRLGEDDAGALPLIPGMDPTSDHYNPANDAGKIGLEFYHGKIGAGGAPQGIGLAPGSTLSMEFTNIDSRYEAPAALPGVLENFGLEAYIQVAPGIMDGRFFYNGDVGFPFGTLTRGYGLAVAGGMYTALVDSGVFPTGVSALPTKAVAMALVNTGGGSFSVYIDGANILNFVAPVNPPAAADVLTIGNFIGNDSPPQYAGVVDEARVFSFMPGQFDPGTDLSPPGLGGSTGDTDEDGDVDLDDLNNVRNHFGSIESPIGDTDGDRDVDLDDLNSVRNHFGASTPGGRLVPEPSGRQLALVLSIILTALSARRGTAAVRA